MAIETFERVPLVDREGRSLISALEAEKISFPNDGVDHGNVGDQLRSLGNGGVEWAAPGMPTYEQTEQAVSDWLDNHPEATTTVQDGSITESKFSSELTGGSPFTVGVDSIASVRVFSDSNSNSVCTLATIPRSNVTPRYAFRSTDYPDKNIYGYVSSLGERTLAFNCSLAGVAVSDGQIRQNEKSASSYYMCIFGFDRNGNPKYTIDDSMSLTAQQLISDGYYNAFAVFYPIVVNGSAFDLSTLSQYGTDRFMRLTQYKQTRMIFGWDDDNYYVLTVEGRLTYSNGATNDECIDLCMALDIPNAFNFDGGSSTQLWACGENAFNSVFVSAASNNSFNDTRSVIGLVVMEG